MTAHQPPSSARPVAASAPLRPEAGPLRDARPDPTIARPADLPRPSRTTGADPAAGGEFYPWLWGISQLARLRNRLGRPTRFIGAFPTREAALASLPAGRRAGYDTPDIAEAGFAAMSRVILWDYPVLHWLARLAGPGSAVLDAGGHMGTKYIAFAEHLDLAPLDWTVYDRPGMVAAARAAQAGGRVPARLRFTDTLPLPGGRGPDILLGSGLLQYIDRPLPALVAEIGAPPRHILLNKVATREGADIVTLERVGGARVPYTIRNRIRFEAEIAAMGYRIRDRWEIPALSHAIPTHLHLGRSVSRGYLLERA